MFISIERLPNPIEADKPNPKAAQALQEALGGQFGEMRTLNQFMFQNLNFRGNGDAEPFRQLLRSIATEELSHIELVATTINLLLEGSSSPSENPDELPLANALDAGNNIHHYLVAGQSARPVDAAGNPWTALYVYDSGNLVLNMLYNLILESTGRLQKSRLYEMSDNKAFRSTVSYLIVRDLLHEKAFAKALEVMGVDWGNILPIPKVDTSKMPEVKELESRNLHNQLWSFGADVSQLSKVFGGKAPFSDVGDSGNARGELELLEGHPEGAAVPRLADAPQEFASGLDSLLKQQIKQNASRAKAAATS